jgi:hypothetical protein
MWGYYVRVQLLQVCIWSSARGRNGPTRVRVIQKACRECKGSLCVNILFNFSCHCHWGSLPSTSTVFVFSTWSAILLSSLHPLWFEKWWASGNSVLLPWLLILGVSLNEMRQVMVQTTRTGMVQWCKQHVIICTLDLLYSQQTSMWCINNHSKRVNRRFVTTDEKTVCGLGKGPMTTQQLPRKDDKKWQWEVLCIGKISSHG